MSSKVVSALLLVCAMAGISVDAATEIKLTASPTNPSEVTKIVAEISTTTEISRNAEFKIRFSTYAFHDEIQCGALTTNIEKLPHSSGVGVESSKGDGKTTVTGSLDLDAAQTASSVPFKIYCRLNTLGDVPANALREISFSIGGATAKTNVSIIGNRCANELSLTSSRNGEHSQVSFSAIDFQKSTDTISFSSDSELLSIAPLGNQVCELEQNGKKSDIVYSAVSAQNGLSFHLPKAAAKGESVHIHCHDTLSIRRIAHIPAIAEYTCFDSNNAGETQTKSWATASNASVASIIGVTVATAIAAIALAL